MLVSCNAPPVLNPDNLPTSLMAAFNKGRLAKSAVLCGIPRENPYSGDKARYWRSGFFSVVGKPDFACLLELLQSPTLEISLRHNTLRPVLVSSSALQNKRGFYVLEHPYDVEHFQLSYELYNRIWDYVS